MSHVTCSVVAMSTRLAKNYISRAFTENLEIPNFDETPKVVSLFAGCGGLDFAFHKAGYESKYVNEYNEFAANTYQSNFAVEVDTRPIEDVNFRQVGKADLVIGGFPCQDFSMIWKRPGLHGTRGNLYTYFLEAIARTKPKAFVAENVVGILSANNGAAIETIINDFEAIKPGYLVIPKLYRFVEYGVPQLRERVILVGIRLDTGFNFVHPTASHGEELLPYVTAGEALEGVSENLSNMEQMNITSKTREMLSLIPAGGNFSDVPRESGFYVKGMISHVYRRIDPSKPATTLIAGGGGGTWGYHFPENRALTNRERARIQSFPDEFIFQGSFTEIRRQIGNAVPPVGMIPVVNALNPLFLDQYERTNLKPIIKRLQGVPVKDRVKLAKQRETLDWATVGLDVQ